MKFIEVKTTGWRGGFSPSNDGKWTYDEKRCSRVSLNVDHIISWEAVPFDNGSKERTEIHLVRGEPICIDETYKYFTEVMRQEINN